MVRTFLFVFPGCLSPGGVRRYSPWEPTETELELLIQNPRRRRVTGNSTIGTEVQEIKLLPTCYMAYLIHLFGGGLCSMQESVCVYTQPMRDDVTLQPRLSLAGLIHKMIPEYGMQVPYIC